MTGSDQASSVDAVDSDQEESIQLSHGEFSEAEIDLISRIYNLVGERWALIAGRIPGRRAEEIEKYCKSMFGGGGGGA